MVKLSQVIMSDFQWYIMVIHYLKLRGDEGAGMIGVGYWTT